MRSLGLGSLGSVELSALIIQVFRHRFRGTPNGSGANLFDDRVIVVGHIDLGRGQSGGAFSRLCALLIVVVIERAEQTDAEPVITVIVARNRQPGHGLAFFHGRSRAECPYGFLGHRLFGNGLCFDGSLGNRLVHSLHSWRLNTRRFGRGQWGQRPKV